MAPREGDFIKKVFRLSRNIKGVLLRLLRSTIFAQSPRFLERHGLHFTQLST